MALLALCLLLAARPTPLLGQDEPPGDPAAGQPLPMVYATRPPDLFVHNAGAFHVIVTNLGTIGDPRTGLELYGGRWRNGEYLHGLELWVGVLGANDQPHVSAGAEFRPSLDPRETIYASFEGAPGGRRQGLSLFDADDDADGSVDEEFLNGGDDDGDGRVDEDIAAVSQQMFCCEYRDDTREAVEAMREHSPLHLRVRQTTMAWSAPGEDEFIGLRYQVANTGDQVLHDVYLGFMLDADVGLKTAAGYWQDDRAWIVALDTTVVDETIQYGCVDRDQAWRNCNRRRIHLDLVCMGDVPRAQGGIRDDLSREANGQVGLLLFSHTTDPRGMQAPSQVGPHAAIFHRKRQAIDLDDFTRYTLLSRGVRAPDSSETPADYACLMSVGPFPELLAGDEIEAELVLTVGAGREGLLANAIRAEQVYHGQWRDLDGRRETGCFGRETCLYLRPGEEPYSWFDPCLFPPVRRLVKNVGCRGPEDYVDTDCNCCTPGGRPWPFCDGQETLVHWMGRIAPPPPTVNTDDVRHAERLEGDRTILLEWDDAPELVADPLTGRLLFCGYRIWRVEGWERHLGSFGPEPDEWQLIAELAPDPVGTQLDLADYTDSTAEVVATVASPVSPGVMLDRHGVGRYFYADTLGLKNGMLYFYDVTSFGCWYENGEYRESSQPPAALEENGVRPRWEAVGAAQWKARVAVVPNPYRGRADWDLDPSNADPQGTRVEFVGLPDMACDIRIYTLAGDLVRTLHHEPAGSRGSLSWNLLSRNGQDVASGVYVYAVTCAGETLVGRCAIIR